MKLRILNLFVAYVICSLGYAQSPNDGGSRASDGSHIIWTTQAFEEDVQSLSAYILNTKASECVLESNYSPKSHIALICNDKRVDIKYLDQGNISQLTYETKILGELASFGFSNISIMSKGQSQRTFVLKRGHSSAKRALLPIPVPVSSEVEEELNKLVTRLLPISKERRACSINIATVTNTLRYNAIRMRDVPESGGYIRCSTNSSVDYVVVPRLDADRESILSILTNKFIEAKMGFVGSGTNKLFHSSYVIADSPLLM